MSCLLFVDDDKNILDINRGFFANKGFTVYTASDFEEACKYLKGYPVDCLVLDILMPGTDGISVCEKIREHRSVPIIFLTGLTEKEFLYRGFTVGCDDFMTKPYDLLELEMRILAAVKRHKGAVLQNQVLHFGPLTIDESRRRVAIGASEIMLTSYELDILLLLARHPEQIFSKQEIYHEVWHMPDIDNTQTIQVHLARMRHKLEKACPERVFIKTVWKQGYQFSPIEKEKVWGSKQEP